MEYRLLGRSGLRVSVLSYGTMTFGGGDEIFQHMGAVQVDEARRLVDLCLEAGVNLFDTADMYSAGRSEEVLGQALGNRRGSVLIATKAFMRMGPGPNDAGLSRQHLVTACEASLRRLGTDYIDLYQVHNFDALTPLEETLRALDDLVRSGKVRYIGCSNYAAWQVMKALAISERQLLERYVSQQVYYSLIGRDLEHDLLPMALDQGVGVLVWSPLAFGLLSGKYRRGQADPAGTRRQALGDLPGADIQKAYAVVEALDAIARRRQVTVAQAALNWLLRRRGVTTVIVGARNEAQLRDNLATATWALSAEEVAQLDKVSEVPIPYPHWHQQKWGRERNPQPGD